MKHKHEPQTWTDSLDKRSKRWRLGTWNVRSLYRADSIVTVSKELSKYRLDLEAPNEQENIHFSMERGMRIMSLVQVFCAQENHISS
jgi:hypothetical protein